MTQPSAVIVTGAASGIGKATVAELSRRGAAVLAVDLAIDATVLPTGTAAPVVAHEADVSDARAVESMVATAVEKLGALNGIFNNAGILGPVAGVAEYPTDAFERVFAVNVEGVFHGMKYAIPALLAGGGGVILNTASTAAEVATRGISAYVASKHAVLGLTRSAAIELAGSGIVVNALCPGATSTAIHPVEDDGGDPEERQARLDAMIPIGRWAQPEEMARVAAWLLLDAPRYLTGVPITVDGAFTAGR